MGADDRAERTVELLVRQVTHSVGDNCGEGVGRCQIRIWVVE